MTQKKGRAPSRRSASRCFGAGDFSRRRAAGAQLARVPYHPRSGHMSTYDTRHVLVAIVGVLVAALPPPVAGGQENAAAARIEAMANRLAQAQRLSVAADCSYDVVQESGQKIEFGE